MKLDETEEHFASRSTRQNKSILLKGLDLIKLRIESSGSIVSKNRVTSHVKDDLTVAQ